MDALPLRRQQESDQKQQLHAAKDPKILHEQQRPQPPGSGSALALFEHGHHRSSKLANTSPPTVGSIFSTVPSAAQPAYPRPPGNCFSLSQWRELELQALIYKYLVAGASVPLELILPIRRSLSNGTPHYSHYQPYPHLQLAMMPTGYWGGSTSDLEPGRCRRTDGKKWRCARDVVAGHKYCERHMHRGRNRSRKHVEAPTPTTGGSDMMRASLTFSPSLGPGEQKQSPSPFDGAGLPPLLGVLPLTGRHPDDNRIKQSLPQQSYYRSFTTEENGRSSRSDAQILRHFFSDWPNEQQQEPDTTIGSSVVPPASTVKLSISIPEQPPKSDFSLKLSTGNDEKHNGFAERAPGDAAAKQVPDSRWSGWIGQASSSMGGPLAEALRLSSATPSPTSVLWKPNASVSETTSSVST